MRPIDADAYASDLWKLRENYQMLDDTHTADKIMHGLYRAEQALKEQPTIPAPRWHRVEDELPDENKEAIFYYELTGISGTVYKNISIIYLCDLISLGYRPIAWMEKPEPPKEDADANK